MTDKTNAFENDLYTDFVSSVMKRQQKLVDGMDILMNLEFDERYKTPKELVFQEDKMKIYHFLPTVPTKAKTPTLMVYAMMNRPYIMDLQSDKSFVKKLLDEGLDL